MKNKKLFAILTLVCFMMTLMPVAAFAAAGEATNDTSAFLVTDADDENVSLKDAKAGISFTAMIQDSKEVATTASALVIWAVDADGNRTSALDVNGNNTNLDYAYYLENVADGAEVMVKFTRPGKYTVYAGLPNAANTGAPDKIDAVGDVNVFAEKSVITVNGTATDPEATYKATLVDGPKHVSAGDRIDAGETIGSIAVAPNNIAETVTVEFENYNADKTYSALKGKTITVDSNSANVDITNVKKLNSLGQFKFDVSASREGSYKIYLDVDGVQFTITVTVGNTAAAYIETILEPTAPQALYGTLKDYNGNSNVRFQVTDINGNIVKGNGTALPTDMGMDELAAKNVKYLSFVEKPAASTLSNSDLSLTWKESKQCYFLNVSSLDAEGTYTVKAVLDNGSYATATWEVKKFQTPVELKLEYGAPSVELGGSLYVSKLVYVDANGVEKNANKVELAATGYAIQNFDETSGAITAKSDEKYVGSNITVTATDSRYNLVANAAVTVANDAKELQFATKTGEVNVNNRITVMVVDEDGNRVAVGGNGTATATEISYVILDKPEGAKVTVNTASVDNNLTSAGSFKMDLTSNKIGNVAVQAIVKVTNRNTADKNTPIYDKAGNVIGYVGADNTQQYVTKYYTGTGIFAIGNGSAGDVVVMSVGSNEIVINDKKAAIDAAPIVKNDRTFVPFRALAEAFGAEVAYDEATQAVTAELNGVKVVMTIGSATYTVNGAEKTMDVAPFINGSRTMVPVRFVAEAFGIKVIPTYDENGATADILFNL